MYKMDNKERDKLDGSVKDMIIRDYEAMLSNRKLNNRIMYNLYMNVLKINDIMNKNMINTKPDNSLTK